jgi:translation elongation factor EF-1alpha
VQHPGLINDRIYKPLVGIANTYYVKMDTKSHQGRDRAISLTDTPTYSNFKALSWIHASQSDLCLFVLNGMTDEMLDEKRIRELILGVCHLMSSRDVIVAVNIKGNDAQAEKRFREKQAKITRILTKAIGPCFDVIPVDAALNIGIFPNSTFPWFKGSALWPMLIENQLRSNYKIEAIEKLRNAPFEFQIAFKLSTRGFSPIAVGRVLSGSISISPNEITDQVRCIPHRDTSVKRIESCYKALKTAVAGDFVGLHLRITTTSQLRRKFGFIWNYIDPLTGATVPIDIALAFRMQFVAVEPKYMGLHETYTVYYGVHRIHCVLLWIFPSENYKTSKDAKKMKNGKAIMVPLERVPMRVYKANEFQKNIHGKVMLTVGTGNIVAIGRIDKVLSTYMDQVPLASHQNQDFINLYDAVLQKAEALFDKGSVEEENLLRAFVEHLQGDKGAQNSIKRFKKRTANQYHHDKNE